MTDFNDHSSSFWDARYADEAYAYGEAPNAYLAAQHARFRPGMRAFVPGDGEGRNGVWLAEQGLDVVSLDLSEAGLRKAERLAAKRGVRIATVRADLTRWTWPVAEFDVVAAIYLHFAPEVRRRMHRAMLDALRPGGLLVVEAFRPEQLAYREAYGSGGPPVEAMLYDAATLRDDFAEAVVLDLESAEVKLGEGAYHNGLAAVVRGVFRRRDEPALT